MLARLAIILSGVLLASGCEPTISQDSRPPSEPPAKESPPANPTATEDPSPLPAGSNATNATESADLAALKGERIAEAERGEHGVLQRFVGVWDLSGTRKPAEWHPDGGDFTGKEIATWGLKNRYILIRDLSESEGKKGLWIATYDPRQNAYPFWGFDSQGLMGAQWTLTWDEATSSATGVGTDMPADWTSGGKNHFTDADTNLVTAWIKDGNGAPLLDQNGRKTRLPDEEGPSILAAWTKHEPPADLPAELQVLDRMIGAWDTVSIKKPAAWSPDGDRDAAIVTRRWILDGRFMMDTSIHSDGVESIGLITFDPQMKAYRSWWFNSLGHRNTGSGSWDEAAQTLSLRSHLEEGRSMETSVRFEDRNQEEWRFLVTDAAGKVYLDMDITSTRRDAAPVEESSAAGENRSDRSQLQGTWGAVSYVQDGQGEGEPPIAPEDSAIRFVFQGDDFLLLASGNAGETPKGSFALGAAGKLKTIDLVFPPESNAGKRQTMPGLYEIDGDTLRITYAPNGARRPSDFKSAAGSNYVAIIFKRITE